MFIFAPIAVALLSLWQGPVPDGVIPKAPAQDKVLARVNGVEIKVADVEPLLWDWRGQEVTSDLITYQLILGEAKKVKVEVTPADINKQYEERVAEFGKQAPPGTNLEETLRARGFPKSRLYIRAHTDILVERIVMRDFHPESFVQVAASAYRTDPSKPDLTGPATRAKAAYDQLVAGEAWEKVIQGSDIDPESKSNAGRIGWRPLDAFPEAARNEVKMLRVGGFSKPIDLPDGASIIIRLEKLGSEATQTELQEVRDQYLSQARSALLDRLRKEAKIERPG